MAARPGIRRDKVLAPSPNFAQSESGRHFSGFSAVVTNARHPIWLPAATRPGAWPFAVLYSVESLSRASIASIIPIQAYDILDDAQAVSMLYFVIGIAGLTATITVPMLIERIARRRVYTIGALALIAAASALSTFTLTGQAVGMFLRVFAAGALAITLNLYIMDYIRKRELLKSESLRMTLSTFSWSRLCGCHRLPSCRRIPAPEAVGRTRRAARRARSVRGRRREIVPALRSSAVRLRRHGGGMAHAGTVVGFRGPGGRTVGGRRRPRRTC